MPANRVITPELATGLAELSAETGRQVGVLVDRVGAVSHVIVGSAHSTPVSEESILTSFGTRSLTPGSRAAEARGT